MGAAELGVHALDALASGLLLYLVAAGLTLVLRTSRFLNLAQAGFVVAGAAGSVAAFRLTGSIMTAIPLACAAFVPVAMAVEILIVRPLRGKAMAAQVVAAFGMFLILGDVTTLLASNGGALLPAPHWLSFTITFPGGFPYPVERLAVITVASAGVLGLMYFSHFTRSGARMRAIADDAEMAAALGIDARKSLSGVFTLACLLATLSGALSIVFLHDGDWSSSGRVLALAVTVVLWGGTSSLRGAFLAALTISFLDSFVRDVLPELATNILPGASGWGAASSAGAIFLLTALILLIRPLGLFGSQRRWESDW
jgi:branched-chain amino acid transport system permease protein